MIWRQGGYIGVDIFFVLSGFLVSGLIFREYSKTGTVNIPRFLARRAFKLYPSLWLLILASLYLISAPIEWYQWVGELFFLQNYLGYVWFHTWSLAVEEHFYLLLSALTVYWQSRALPPTPLFRYIPQCFVLITIVCLVLRVVTVFSYDFSLQRHVFPTHLRLDGLMLGTFLGYQWHFKGLAHQLWWRRYRYGLLGVGFFCLLPAFLLPQSTAWLNIIGYNFFSVGSAALLLGFLAFNLERAPFTRFIGRLGSYSYSIYLWHLPIEIITRTVMEPRGWLAGNGWYWYLAIYVIGSILWGIALYILVELPFMRLRDYWFPSQIRGITPASGLGVGDRA